MKKAFLALLGFAALSVTAQAQDTASENRKATAGNIALEANLNLFNGNNMSLSNSLNQIKGRYFLSDDMALRMGVHIGYSNQEDESLGNPRLTERKSFDFSLNPGIEKHFGGTERLSPYVGAELSLQYHGASARITDNDGDVTEYEGMWENGNNRGYIGLGLNGLAGFDYYLAKNFFVGYELGLGLNFRSEREGEVIANGNVVALPGGSRTNLGPYVLNGIRVGFVLK